MPAGRRRFHAIALYLCGAGAAACSGGGPVGALALEEPPASLLASGPRVLQMATGDAFACAVVADGRVLCWGAGDRGQLGDGLATDRSTGAPVAGLADVRQVALGGAHACALLARGTVSCWGDNAAGQIGDGTSVRRPLPVPVPGLGGVIALALGARHSCALLAGGTVDCWGRNEEGQAGAPRSPSVPVPTPVSGLAQVRALAAGHGTTCALRADRSVWCWGADDRGQLGVGSGDADADEGGPTPRPVAGLTDATAIAVAQGTGPATHACAVRAGGGVVCWGDDRWGQLGDGGETEHGTPVRAREVHGAVALALGEGHSCAISAAGTVSCWGHSDPFWYAAARCGSGHGWDGVADAQAFCVSPTVVGGLAGAKAIAHGGHFACALLADGAVDCWGDDSRGQLGHGGAIGVSHDDTPRPVELVNTAR